MSKSFDPYYHWLGISPKEQPPNHYRLLGLELFEDNVDVISVAADRQMGHLRSFQWGQHGVLSQKILNEIAAARLCLLDRRRKGAYDARLRSEHLTKERIDGAALGEYLLMDHIANGTTGRIYKAQHRTMGRLVALKVLSCQATRSPQQIMRFQRKINILARLNHPNLVTAFDAGQRDGTFYLIMEYVDGPNLIDRIKQQRGPEVADVVDYITQAASGLGYAHRQGLVHRNVSPANLLVNEEGVVKVIGLGMALFTGTASLAGEDDEIESNERGRLLGTPDFMAPEQARDCLDVDPRADIYALGCTLFTLLTRRLPYSVKRLRDKLAAHRTQPPPSARQFCSDVPPALDSVLQKMMAKDRDDRYATMREVISALQSGLNSPSPSSMADTTAALGSLTLTIDAMRQELPADLDALLSQLADETPYWKRKRK